MGPILVVEDESAVRRTIVRFVRQYRGCREAASAAEAMALIGKHDDWTGFILDVSLGDEPDAGLHLLGAVRRVFPAVPAALLTASRETSVINRAALLSASFMAKPFGTTELIAFLARISAIEAGLAEDLEGRLQLLRFQWSLNPLEVDVLAWLIAGRSQGAWVDSTGSNLLEWRKAVTALLKKSGTKDPDSLVNAILAEHVRARRRQIKPK